MPIIVVINKSEISKSEAIRLLQNIDLTEKIEHCKAKYQEQL